MKEKDNVLTIDDIIYKVKDNDNNVNIFYREINIEGEDFLEKEVTLHELKNAFGNDIIPFVNSCSSNVDQEICGCNMCENVKKCDCKESCIVHYLKDKNECPVVVKRDKKIKVTVPEGKEIMLLNKNYLALSIICEPQFLTGISRKKGNNSYKIILEIKREHLKKNLSKINEDKLNIIVDLIIGYLDGVTTLANITEDGNKKQLYFEFSKDDIKRLEMSKQINYGNEWNLSEFRNLKHGKFIDYAYNKMSKNMKEIFNTFKENEDLEEYVNNFANDESIFKLQKIFLLNTISLNENNVFSNCQYGLESGLYQLFKEESREKLRETLWLDDEMFVRNKFYNSFSASLFLFFKLSEFQNYEKNNKNLNIASNEYDIRRNEIKLLSKNETYVNSTTKEAIDLITSDVIDDIPNWVSYLYDFLKEISYDNEKDWDRNQVIDFTKFKFPDPEKFSRQIKLKANEFIFSEVSNMSDENIEQLSLEMMGLLQNDTRCESNKIKYFEVNNEIIIEVNELNWLEMAKISIDCAYKILNNNIDNILKKEMLSKIVMFLKRFEFEIFEYFESNTINDSFSEVLKDSNNLIGNLIKSETFNTNKSINLEDIILENLKMEKLAPSIFYKESEVPKEKQLLLALEQVKIVILEQSITSVCDSEIGSGKTLITVTMSKYLSSKGYNTSICMGSNSSLLKEYLRYLALENVIVVTGPFWKGKCTVQIGKKLAGKIGDKMIYMKKHININDILCTLNDDFINRSQDKNDKAPINLNEFKKNGCIMLFAESYSNFKFMLGEYRKSIERSKIIKESKNLVDSFDFIVIDDCEISQVPKFYNNVKTEYICDRNELENLELQYKNILGEELMSNIESVVHKDYFIFSKDKVFKSIENIIFTREDKITDIAGNMFNNGNFKLKNFINENNEITDSEENIKYYICTYALNQDISNIKNLIFKNKKVKDYKIKGYREKYYLEECSVNLKTGIYGSDELYSDRIRETSTLLINADFTCDGIKCLPQIYSSRANIELFYLDTTNRIPWYEIIPELKDTKTLDKCIIEKLSSPKCNLTNLTIRNSYSFPELFSYIKKNLFLIFSYRSWQYKFRELTRDFFNECEEVTYIGVENENSYIESNYIKSDFFERSKKLHIVNNTYDIYFRNNDFRKYCVDIYSKLNEVLNNKKINSNELSCFEDKNFDFKHFTIEINLNLANVFDKFLKLESIFDNSKEIMNNYLSLYFIFKLIRGENFNDMIVYINSICDLKNSFQKVDSKYLSKFEEILNELSNDKKEILDSFNEFENFYTKNNSNCEFLSVDKARGANIEYFVGEVHIKKDVDLDGKFINQYLGRAGRSFLLGACWFLRGYVNNFDSSVVLNKMTIKNDNCKHFENEEIDAYLKDINLNKENELNNIFSDNTEMFGLLQIKNLYTNMNSDIMLDLIKHLNNNDVILNDDQVKGLTNGFEFTNTSRNGKSNNSKIRFRGASAFYSQSWKLLSLLRSPILRYLITIYLNSQKNCYGVKDKDKDNTYKYLLEVFYTESGEINDIFERDIKCGDFSKLIGKFNLTLEDFLRFIFEDKKFDESEMSCSELIKIESSGKQYVDRIFDVEGQLYIIQKYFDGVNWIDIENNYNIGSRLYDIKEKSKLKVRCYLDKNSKKFKSLTINSSTQNFMILDDIINSEKNSITTCDNFVKLVKKLHKFFEERNYSNIYKILTDTSNIVHGKLNIVSFGEKIIESIDRKKSIVYLEDAYNINKNQCSTKILDQDSSKLLKILYDCLTNNYKNRALSIGAIYELKASVGGINDLYFTNNKNEMNYKDFKFNDLNEILVKNKNVSIVDFVNDIVDNFHKNDYCKQTKNFCNKIEYIFNIVICMYFLSTYKLPDYDKKIFFKNDEYTKYIIDMLITLRSFNGNTNRMDGFTSTTLIKKCLVTLTNMLGMRVQVDKLVKEFELKIEDIYQNFLSEKRSYIYKKDVKSCQITFDYKIEEKFLELLKEENISILIKDVIKYIEIILNTDFPNIHSKLLKLKICSNESSTNLVEMQFNNDIEQYVQFIKVIRMKNPNDINFIQKYLDTFTKEYGSGSTMTWANALGMVTCLIQIHKLEPVIFNSIISDENVKCTNLLNIFFDMEIQDQNIFDIIFSLKIGKYIKDLVSDRNLGTKISKYFNLVREYVKTLDDNKLGFFKNLISNILDLKIITSQFLTLKIMNVHEFEYQKKYLYEINVLKQEMHVSEMMKEAFLMNIDEPKKIHYIAISSDNFEIHSGHYIELESNVSNLTSGKIIDMSKKLVERNDRIVHLTEKLCEDLGKGFDKQHQITLILERICTGYIISSDMNKCSYESRNKMSVSFEELDIKICLEGIKKNEIYNHLASSNEFYFITDKMVRNKVSIELMVNNLNDSGFISKQLYRKLENKDRYLLITSNGIEYKSKVPENFIPKTYNHEGNELEIYFENSLQEAELKEKTLIKINNQEMIVNLQRLNVMIIRFSESRFKCCINEISNLKSKKVILNLDKGVIGGYKEIYKQKFNEEEFSNYKSNFYKILKCLLKVCPINELLNNVTFKMSPVCLSWNKDIIKNFCSPKVEIQTLISNSLNDSLSISPDVRDPSPSIIGKWNKCQWTFDIQGPRDNHIKADEDLDIYTDIESKDGYKLTQILTYIKKLDNEDVNNNNLKYCLSTNLKLKENNEDSLKKYDNFDKSLKDLKEEYNKIIEVSFNNDVVQNIIFDFKLFLLKQEIEKINDENRLNDILKCITIDTINYWLKFDKDLNFLKVLNVKYKSEEFISQLNYWVTISTKIEKLFKQITEIYDDDEYGFKNYILDLNCESHINIFRKRMKFKIQN